MKFKITLLLLLLLACGTVTVCFYIFRKFYKKELSLRLSPLTENNSLQATSTKFWMLGDSRIFQWPIPESVMLKNEYCNLGVNAQTTAQVLYRFREHLDHGIPEYVFLQAGINDLKAIGVFPGKKEQIIDQCIKNIELIFEICRDRKVIPIFCNIFPPGRVELLRRPFWSSDIKVAVGTVNDSLAAYCKNKSIAVFDAYSVLNDGSGLVKKEYQLDDLHLNKSGYDKLSAALKEFLINKKIKE